MPQELTVISYKAVKFGLLALSINLMTVFSQCMADFSLQSDWSLPESLPSIMIINQSKN